MKFCSSCGTQLADGAKFCPKCGHPVEQIANYAEQNSQPAGEESQQPVQPNYNSQENYAQPVTPGTNNLGQQWQQPAGESFQQPYNNQQQYYNAQPYGQEQNTGKINLDDWFFEKIYGNSPFVKTIEDSFEKLLQPICNKSILGISAIISISCLVLTILVGFFGHQNVDKLAAVLSAISAIGYLALIHVVNHVFDLCHKKGFVSSYFSSATFAGVLGIIANTAINILKIKTDLGSVLVGLSCIFMIIAGIKIYLKTPYKIIGIILAACYALMCIGSFLAVLAVVAKEPELLIISSIIIFLGQIGGNVGLFLKLKPEYEAMSNPYNGNTPY